MEKCPKCGLSKIDEVPLCHRCIGRRPRTEETEKQRLSENHYIPCPKCGEPMAKKSAMCAKCAGRGVKTEEYEAQRVWKNHHKPCPICGTMMCRTSTVCYACSGQTHPTPEQTQERLRKKSKKGYETHKEDRLDYAHKRYLVKKDDIIRQHHDYRHRHPEIAYAFNGDSPLLTENKYQLLYVQDRPCEVCGSKKRREVHHVVFRSQGGSDELENLQVLCFTHHRGAGTGVHSAWSIEE